MQQQGYSKPPRLPPIEGRGSPHAATATAAADNDATHTIDDVTEISEILAPPPPVFQHGRSIAGHPGTSRGSSFRQSSESSAAAAAAGTGAKGRRRGSSSVAGSSASASTAAFGASDGAIGGGVAARRGRPPSGASSRDTDRQADSGAASKRDGKHRGRFTEPAAGAPFDAVALGSDVESTSGGQESSSATLLLQQRLMALQKARFVPVDYRPVAWTVVPTAAGATTRGRVAAGGATTGRHSGLASGHSSLTTPSRLGDANLLGETGGVTTTTATMEAERQRRLDSLRRTIRHHRAARIQRWWRRLRLAAEVERHGWVVQRLRHLHERALIIQHWWHAVCVRRQYATRAERPPVTVAGLSAGAGMARARIDLALARAEGAALVNAVRPSAIQLWDSVLARRQ